MTTGFLTLGEILLILLVMLIGAIIEIELHGSEGDATIAEDIYEDNDIEEEDFNFDVGDGKTFDNDENKKELD